MFTAQSQTITEDYKYESTESEEWEFKLNNGNTGVMEVSNVYLSEQDIAKERAYAEFIENAYKTRKVRVKTYLTNFEINDILYIGGFNYIVKNIYTKIDDVKMITTLEAERYE